MPATTRPGDARGSWRRDPRASVGRTYPVPADAPAGFAIVVESHSVAVATEWEPHTHTAHELVWVRHGTLTARVGAQVFTVSEGFGLWLPAGQEHAGRLTAGVELYDAFFAPGTPELTPAGPDSAPQGLDTTTVVAMVPVLQALLVHLARPDLDPSARARAEAVVLDVLEPSDRQLAVRLPADDRVDTIVEALLADPADERSLDEWARASGTSARTITRVFRATTGLSFAQWRQAVRVHRSLELLGAGHPVQDVADELGYAHPSTFIDAFRRVMGTTPGVFAADR
ncbi:helix-turn-helix domain-containing protein [Promicromonospora sukumoe]|uniref:helix-turn-helix domain-containing protein n=1 Tax=Promicromonospora sukumoe TaxID=88382 RepID=UPI00037E6BD8|nr:AraC family transcriptional regulator [Promicromonospora sukumoe]